MRFLTIFAMLLLPLLGGCSAHGGFDVRVQSESKEIQWGQPANGLVAGIAYEHGSGGPLRFACYLKNVSEAPIRVLAPSSAARPAVAYELREMSADRSQQSKKTNPELPIALAPGATHRSELEMGNNVSLYNFEGVIGFAYSNVATEVFVGGERVRDLWIGEAVSGSIPLTVTARPVDRFGK